jgi:hypothetical protein
MNAAGDDAVNGYARLAQLVEAELELLREGRLPELRDAVRQTGLYIATLPRPVPPGARPHVVRAQALRARLAIELRREQARMQQTHSARRYAMRVARRYFQGTGRRFMTNA